MKRDLLDDLPALRARLASVHGPERADHAIAAGLFLACQGVYVEACRRTEAAKAASEAAQRELLVCLETQQEWLCICHGQALQVAGVSDGDDLSHTYET